MRSLFRLSIAGAAVASVAMTAFSATAGPYPDTQARWSGWGLVGHPYYGYPAFYGYGYYPSAYGAYTYGAPYYGSGYRWVYLFPPDRPHRWHRHR
jgi:hypothetical protein